MTIGKRLNAIRGDRTQADFASMFGIHKSTYSRYERDEFPPDSNFLSSVCTKMNISPSWLLLGDGPMYKEQSSEVGQEVAKIEPEMDPRDYILVPQLESKVSAGPDGAILYEEVAERFPFKRWWIERLVGKSAKRHEHLILVRVRGDSMTPTINMGELALVDFDERERITIRPGRIYLVMLPDGGVSMKRLVINKDETGVKLICLSDNPEYQPFEVELEPDRRLQRYVLGRIRWVGKEFD
jgi:phage repressor protein C with HTH and peptisase S24 domain